MKARIKDNGFLVKTSQYSESSLIVKAFTRQHGMISIIAKGIRKKQDACLLIPLNEYEFSLYEPLEGGLFLLSEFSPVAEYDLASKVECWSAAECALELYSQLIIPTEESPDYYHLLKTWMDYLRNQDRNTILLWWRFLLRVFRMLGTPYHTDGCSLCGETENIIAAFDKGNSNLICPECLSATIETDRYEKLDLQSIEIFRLLPEIGNHLSNVIPTGSTVRQINQLFSIFYSSHYNNALKLRSLNVLEQFYS